ncbi:MAG TPA: DUF6600 domain-containing protein [Acidiphilium sp.]
MRSRIRFILAFSTAIGLALPALRTARAQTETAPPDRVGQIAAIDGPVSFDGSATGGWTQAALNYPVISGDALYTQPNAQAAIAIDWSRVTLAGGTEFQVTSIDPNTVQAALSQGEVFLDLRDLAPGASYVVTTPRGAVTITRNGRYDILAGDQNDPTMVTVINGAAVMQGQDVSLDIGPGETATLSGANPVNASLGGAQRDPFTMRMLEVRQAPPPAYIPPVVNRMTGAYQLAQYGSWTRTPQYGAIWYPRVAPGWVPYRDGHWAYVAPWGWTWVDADPWGFAPFHYGRWVQYGGRWGWAPAPVPYAAPAYYQPVYAPALVSFFSIGSGVSLSVGITAGAIAAGSIGWVPLAPGEPYLPWYHCPPRYIRQVNYYNVRNVDKIVNINRTTIINRTVINNYGPTRLINRGAATVMPASAMRQGDPVARFAHPAPHTVLASARMVPPAAFHPGPGAAHNALSAPNHGPNGQPGSHGAPHSAPTFGRLPAAPASLAHRAPAPAPRPAPFATERGLPVAHPGPVRESAQRPEIRTTPNRPAAGHPSPEHFAPATSRPPVPPQAQHEQHSGMPHMPPPPVQQNHAQQPRHEQYRPPATPRPPVQQNHAQQPRPEQYRAPAAPRPPAQQYHPPAPQHHPQPKPEEQHRNDQHP